MARKKDTRTTEQLLAEVTDGGQALVCPRAAAAYLGCHERTVTRMCERGALRGVRVMSMWRVNRASLIEFAEGGVAHVA